ncbi:MAG: arsenate reductase family protein [Firmicutes bacterium]|nr:arsenate reductase family protein [Bacillota bacterium]
MEFICYPKCTTCQKAQTWLKSKGKDFSVRDIKVENPTEEELTEWIKRSNLPIKRFFNTSGLKYKELGLKDKLATMSDEEKIGLLATDGMLVKRPILITDDGQVLVGFKEAQWEEAL